MYIKRIYLKDVGPISELKIEPRFDVDGNPIPIVIVGQNGSGKSLTLSMILDAMTEIRRKVFSKLKEAPSDSYLKVMSKNYIKFGRIYSRAELVLARNAEDTGETKYLEIISYVPGEKLPREIYHLGDLGQDRWASDGYHKQADIHYRARPAISKLNFLFFPYFRYEKAAWLSDEAIIDFVDVNKYAEEAQINTVRTSIIDETKRWILNLLLDRELYEKQIDEIVCNVDGKEKLVRHFFGYKGHNTDIIGLIRQILTAMLQAKDETISSVRLIPGKKTSRNFAVVAQRNEHDDSDLKEKVVAPDLKMLSSGELVTLSLATEIIRAYEVLNPQASIELSQVTGIVIIDEIDLHLHINFQKEVLPSIIRLFPRVQFVVTTHSPFFVIGMQQSGDVDIISLPIGNKIAPEEFSEFQVSYDTFIEENEKFKKRFADLNAKIVQDGRPLIVTEGKTDWQHIKDALSIARSSGRYLDVEVDFFEFNDPITMGDEKLKQMCESIAILSNKKKLIFIFDRDNKKIIDTMSGKPEIFKCHGNEVFSFCLPIPSHRTEYKYISIEFFYQDSALRTSDPVTNRRIYFTNEINKIVSMTTNKVTFQVLDAPKAYEELDKKIFDADLETIRDAKNSQVALSKSQFFTKIVSNTEISGAFDRSSFDKVFDIIRAILSRPIR